MLTIEAQVRCSARVLAQHRVDPVTVGAVLLTVVTGTSEALGGQLWAGAASIVRRPSRSKKNSDPGAAARSGEAELLAPRESPGDRQNALALAVALARAAADAEFERAVGMVGQAGPVRERSGTSRMRSAAVPSTGRYCRARRDLSRGAGIVRPVEDRNPYRIHAS